MREVSLLKVICFKERAKQLENINARDLDVLSSKERQRTIIRAHIAEVCLLYLLAKTLASTFFVQHKEDFGRAARFPYCYNISI